MALSTPFVVVLAYFLESPSRLRYGLEISRDTGVRPNRMYPLLARLEADGWLESGWEDVDPHAAGRPARRLYRMTQRGSAEAWNELGPIYERLRVAKPQLGAES